MKTELTQRQKEILLFIQSYIYENGYPPTYREIGSRFEIASTFGVKRHIDALVKKGYLNFESNISRSLSLTEYAVNFYPKKDKIKNFDSSIEIPIIGRVAAGYPVISDENIEGTLFVDKSLIKQRANVFGLRVRGDSMINSGILEGDIVIVNQQKNANNGEIVIAMVDGESTMKRFKKTGEKIFLVPENDNYPVIKLNKKQNFSIIGKVVGVFRSYN